MAKAEQLLQRAEFLQALRAERMEDAAAARQRLAGLIAAVLHFRQEHLDQISSVLGKILSP